jgi:hypothetical protein
MNLRDRNHAARPRGVARRWRPAAWLGAATLVLATPAALVAAPSPAAAQSVDAHGGAIDAVRSAGIAQGFEDGSFRPASPVTRGQMSSFLGRALELDAQEERTFSDSAGSVHAGMIEAVAAAGVALGYRDGTFRPNADVTRGQMASFLMRALGLEPGSGRSFPDTRGDTHAGAIEAVSTAGIALGYRDGTFRPSETVTRGQMASFLARGFELIESPATSPVSSPAEPATPIGDVDCDVTVATSDDEVDDADPGDVVCLAPGRRGALKLSDLVGTAAQPITVVNHGGVVEIDDPGAYAGIRIENSSHLRITGTGVAAQCGARFSEADQACGIVVSAAGNGLTGKVRTEHLMVDHVEVGGVSSSGMGVHDKDVRRGGWVQRDVAFHDIYLHDIATEGHYHGASKYREGTRGLLDGVEIVRNLVVRTGRDGIQVGSTPWNCSVRDNVVARAGLSGESSHAFGIIINRGAACDVIGNRISDSAGDGIYDQGLHGQTIADNTIVRSGLSQDGAGINVREGDQAAGNPETPDYPRSTHVLRNRVDGTSEHGIRLRNSGGTDNRVIDNHLSSIARGDAVNLGSGARADVRDNRTD